MSAECLTADAETNRSTMSLEGPKEVDKRTFWALIASMFQNALSDNIFKFILTMMAINQAIRETAVNGVPDLVAADALGADYQLYIGIAFAAPWIIAFAVAGWLGDRFSKSRVTQGTKVMEISIMVVSIWALAHGGLWPSLLVLFLLSLQAALFGPAKYGILAEILPAKKLGWGNGLLQGLTFVAILLGTLLGPKMYATYIDRLWMNGIILVGLSVAGLCFSMVMRHTPAAAPRLPLQLNPFRDLMISGREILASSGITWCIAGQVTFWTVAVMLQSAVLLVAKTTMGLSDGEVGYAVLPIAIGMGVGCFLVSYICKNRNELGLVPLGAFFMFAGGVVVWMITPTKPELALYTHDQLARLIILLPMIMGIMGITCGMIIVPLEAFLVHEVDPRIRGGVLATTNLMIAFGWMLGAVLYALVNKIRGNVGDVFLASGLLMFVVCVVMCVRFPLIPLRFLSLVFFRSFYRSNVAGLKNIPERGGAMLAPNHQSYIDAVILSALVDRPIRFVMSEMMYRQPLIYPFAKLSRSIPVETTQSPRQLIEALREAGQEIRRGGLVCLFPEGQLTRTGSMMPFQRGIERVMKDLDEPVIPIAIDGAYDTGLSLREGRVHLGASMPWRRKAINVVVGEAVGAKTPPAELHRIVRHLGVDAFAFRRADAKPLHRMAMDSLRSHVNAELFADHLNEKMVSNKKVLAMIVLLGTRLKREWGGEATVGFLLPPCISAMALNITALLAGKLPVNMNYTASKQINTEICRTAEINLVITARTFVEKAKFELPDGARVLYMEDLTRDITAGEKFAAALRGIFQPVASLERFLGRTTPATIDDTATLIFSSGSTGVPKGVMLSHWNITSNAIGAAQYARVNKGDRMLGILPFFHSFGYLGTLWVPLLKKVGVTFHPNPLDARVIGALVERDGVTHLFATPTFLSTYTRRVDRGQFGSLKFVLTGAEKLRDFVAKAFEEKFGIRPREGFGCTECSPAVALNADDFRGRGIYQEGTREGSVGQPIPGVVVKIVDVETGVEVDTGVPGMLLVRGACVMQGYYKMPEKTAEVLRDNWYQTGDIAKVDVEGFLTITDRLSRFSKIGGEMVPHIRIEESLQLAFGGEEQVFAVTGVPDEKKGERLCVLHTLPEEKARAASEAISGADYNLPSLWIPKWADFIRVDAIPILGTGKMDLRKIKELAMEKAVGE
ncbi:MFS transporter [Candidatus Sumerlaeota bacterium]|nr:MFS transporter [Candidatus Sumerlaeota bacterium]